MCSCMEHCGHVISPPTVLALFSFHSHCFCSFSIYFLHFAFMFLLLVFMSFHFNCMSFHFDDPRSGMFNPMSVKRILNAKGTAFTWMFSTRKQLYFIPPVPSSTSACNTFQLWNKTVNSLGRFGYMRRNGKPQVEAGIDLYRQDSVYLFWLFSSEANTNSEISCPTYSWRMISSVIAPANAWCWRLSGSVNCLLHRNW